MRKLGEVHKKVTNSEPIYQAVTCTTDARHFKRVGIPVTCYGPESTSIHG